MRSAIFEVPGKPQGKARVRVALRGKFVRAYTPEETVNYESYIRLCYNQCPERRHFVREALKMTIIAYFAIPQSWSRKKQEQAATGLIRPTVKPDCDNIAKIVADALNGIAYADDKQICELSVIKKYGDTAYLRVTLQEVEYDRQ